MRGTGALEEGHATSLYWQGVCRLLPPQRFPGRVHRGAADPFNTLLNYGHFRKFNQSLENRFFAEFGVPFANMGQVSFSLSPFFLRAKPAG